MLSKEIHEIKIEGFEPIYKGIPPFMKYEGGYGYQGVLLEKKETGELQCHLCGGLSLNLAKHIFHKHKDISVREYKMKVGLGLTTPMMSERTRKKLKNNFLELTEEKRKEVIARLMRNNKKLHSKGGNYKKRGEYSSTQYLNKFGTCPEQAKTLFHKEYKELGHIPTNSEMSEKLRYLVYKMFSSYKEALVVWGVSEEEYRNHVANGKQKAVDVRASNDYFPKFSKEQVKKAYSDFFFEKKRFPTWNEVREFGLPGRAPFQRAFGVNKSEIEASFTVRKSELI